MKLFDLGPVYGSWKRLVVKSVPLTEDGMKTALDMLLIQPTRQELQQLYAKFRALFPSGAP